MNMLFAHESTPDQFGRLPRKHQGLTIPPQWTDTPAGLDLLALHTGYYPFRRAALPPGVYTWAPAVLDRAAGEIVAQPGPIDLERLLQQKRQAAAAERDQRVNAFTGSEDRDKFAALLQGILLERADRKGETLVENQDQAITALMAAGQAALAHNAALAQIQAELQAIRDDTAKGEAARAQALTDYDPTLAARWPATT